GVSKPVVGITVPTGYSFNLDGTAIYLTMASLFVSSAMGMPMSIPEQISLLVFMIIASKGAAGVTGAGLATLAAGLQSHRPELLDGMGVIVGIDKFMSEARALTNFTGNAVATLLIGKWTGEIDLNVARATLSGQNPFDELSLEPDAHGPTDAEATSEAEAQEQTPASPGSRPPSPRRLPPNPRTHAWRCGGPAGARCEVLGLRIDRLVWDLKLLRVGRVDNLDCHALNNRTKTLLLVDLLARRAC